MIWMTQTDDLSRVFATISPLCPVFDKRPPWFLFRPATADKVDDDSLLVANPSRPDRPADADSAALNSLYFVLLMAETQVKQKRAVPFRDLRLGTALGTGDRPLHHPNLFSWARIPLYPKYLNP